MSLRWRSLASRSRLGSGPGGDGPWEPDECVKLLANPDLTRLTVVKRELGRASSSWMTRFLELDGLDALFCALDAFSGHHEASFQDAVLQLHCVECLRALMNARTGLDHIVKQPRYTRKLAEALASPNRVVRKQVLELLSAVCVYAPGGQVLALDALDHLRASTGREHRFSVLVDELSHPEVLPYAATVLAFINCVLISTDDFRERLRLRNQLLGLGFLELVEPLRRSGDDELFIQCHVFETTREADDEHALSLGLTASGNHYEAFAAVMNKAGYRPTQQSPGRSPRHRSHLAWELLERLSQQLSSGPVLPLYNAMGPKLTPTPPELAAMERLDNGCSRHRGGSEGESEGLKKSSARGGTDAQVSALSRSTSYRSKSTQARRSSQPSPVVRRNQEVVGVERCPNSTNLTKRSIEASPQHSPSQRSSPRSTQLTRSSVLRSSTDGQPPVVAAACKTRTSTTPDAYLRLRYPVSLKNSRELKLQPSMEARRSAC
ncbi:hypothetical protein HPB52_016832 [Rhipicephalus sanguineus]|uniref:GBD/FH3 domain-containing protein n=1 Tax=Rhipicephalus sanguineus TaxID=34632 RepID=A0A9D4Q9T0_RHISA|nr:hypothetical protein HPB52_016832 [Rhipicephalus sanguineus]